jgi:4-alpha-glucanotransferase
MDLRWWQMLPIGPTGFGDSPYQSPSTFAGNPLLISLEDLAADGLLTAQEIHGEFETERVDFATVIPWKRKLLGLAAQRFTLRARAFDAFLHAHGEVWLDDFAIFTACKRANQLRPWWEWDQALASRDPKALARASEELADEIQIVKIEQYLFDRQFQALRKYAALSDVALIGDIPIFVAHDSADVWANPSLFILDKNNDPVVVAGVPPDYFSVTGQRWGNPLYDWDRHVETGFDWWTARMARVFDLFAKVRIDHFRGFVAAWHIPATEETAMKGEWVEAPGRELLEHLRIEFGDLPVIAEDLGLITPDVEKLRDEFGLPGMKVMQFGFGTESAHAIDQFRKHVVAYTGTHDNDTAMGWFGSADPDREPERATALSVLGGDGSDFSWRLIEAVFSSVADIAIAPLQDLLALGTEARMNTPGVASGNWQWRFSWDALTPSVTQRMTEIVHSSGRAEP